MQNKKSAFTLVELIVVITILAILGVIGFISLNSYNTYARDSLRLSNIRTAISGLEIQYTQGGYYSVPDNAVEIGSGTSIVLKQGTIGSKVERAIKSSRGIGLDPVTQQEYTYSTNTSLSKFEILAFFEGDTTFSPHLAFPKGRGIIGDSSYAEDINQIRTFGKEIGVLTNETGTPIEKITSIQTAKKLDLAIDTDNYVAHFNDTDSQTFSGSTMNDLIVYKNQNQTNGCPVGFIKVPGNSEFSTSDFCVAQYEMSYIDADIPNSTGYGSDWNTTHYDSTKTVVSIAGKYPIVDITQPQAITECSKIGGHLITNNEWMTIARNVEAEPVNWNTKADGVTKYLPNGVSNDLVLGCEKNGGNTETRNNATKTGSPCDGGKNKLKLSNGEEIYDLSGNVREHVNKENTIDGSDFNLGETSVSGSSNGINWDDDGIYDEIDMLKYGSKNLLGTNNGMGNLFYANGKSNNNFIRGGNGNHGSHAGIFTLHLYTDSDSSNKYVGFRCVK